VGEGEKNNTRLEYVGRGKREILTVATLFDIFYMFDIFDK